MVVDDSSTFDASTDEVITDSASREASKADVSALATSAEISALNDFDPSTDTVTVGNPDDCKADVSSLATSAELAAVETKIDTIDSNVDSIKTGVDKLTAEYDFEVDYTNGKLYIYTKDTTTVIEEYDITVDSNNRITDAEIV